MRITRSGLLASIASVGLLVSTRAWTQSSNSAPLSPERIAQIVASPDRSPADRSNDLRRKPEPMLGFIGIRPGMVALDLSAAGGYTTELLARAIGPSGAVYGQSPPPRDPNRRRRPLPPARATAIPRLRPARHRLRARRVRLRLLWPSAIKGFEAPASPPHRSSRSRGRSSIPFRPNSRRSAWIS